MKLVITAELDDEPDLAKWLEDSLRSPESLNLDKEIYMSLSKYIYEYDKRGRAMTIVITFDGTK